MTLREFWTGHTFCQVIIRYVIISCKTDFNILYLDDVKAAHTT